MTARTSSSVRLGKLNMVAVVITSMPVRRFGALLGVVLSATSRGTDPSGATKDVESEPETDGAVIDADDAALDLASEEVETTLDAREDQVDARLDSIPDTSPSKDAGGDTDAPPLPPCVERGGLYFSRPNLFFSISTVYGSHAFAANRDRRLAIVFGEPGLASYIDSLDGGRSFRPVMHIPQLSMTNMNVAVGPRHVHITSARVDSEQAVRHATAEIDTFQDPSQLVVTQFSNSNAGRLVPSAQDWIAVILRAGFFSSAGSFASVAKTPLLADFSEPQKISTGETCTGLWHSSGTFYVVDPIDVSGSGLPRLDLRWSNDAGTTFSSPLMIVSTNGLVGCPALYEQVDGNILIVSGEGLTRAPEPQIVARTFDRATQEISRTVVVAKELGVSCFSVARASSRTYLTRGVGDQQALRVELTYSDDDGQTWSPFIEVPYLNGLGCPKMAAAGDEGYLHWRTSEGLQLTRVGNAGACDMSPP